MYIDPRLGGLLLEPLFRLQASPSYKIPYPVTDLGASPNWRLEALIIEDLKGRNTPMSQSATHITTNESNVRISLESSRELSLLILLACSESGNMLIMAYAHVRASGDGSLINRYVCAKLQWVPVEG